MAGAGVGRRIPVLQRWLGTIVALLETDAAVLIVSHDGLSRIVAGSGIRHPMVSWRFDFESAPYGRGDTVLLKDAAAHPEFHALLGDAALNRTHFFYRIPIAFPGQATIAVIAYGRDARPGLSDRQIRLSEEIATALAQEFGDLIAPDRAEIMPGTVGFVYEGLASWVTGHALPLALIDDKMRLILANDALRGLGPSLAALKLGTEPFPSLPAGEVVRSMMLRALATGESTPEIEVRHDSPDTGLTRYFAVMGSPFRIAKRSKPVILVSLIEITREVLAHDRFEQSGQDDRRSDRQDPAEATVHFLTETLVERRSVRSRKGVSYLTTRAWREPIRAHQIKALKLLKASASPRLAAAIATDLKIEIEALMGGGGFRAVVPVPCGFSQPGQCLSRHIALELAHALGVPMVEALRLPQSDETSHPRKNARRSRMNVLRPPEGPVLVVDDVATSGEHIEEACRLLRSFGIAVMGLVWIGGNATDSD